MTLPTPYDELNLVLSQLIDGIRAALGETLIGVYLQGSFAIGDFDEHSDVDFVVAIRDELTDDQVKRLQQMHADVYDLPYEWAKHLEGSYFPLEVLRDPTRAGEPLWYLDHGARALKRSDHCNTLLVRCATREHGVVLTGPAPSTLIDPISVEHLRRETGATMRNWGGEILRAPDQWANRFYQTYLVLNFSRMLRDLIRGRPGSKRAGAEWAKTMLDPAWHSLIDRAWSGRPDPARSVRTPADPADFESTLRLLRMLIDESEQWLKVAVDGSVDWTSVPVFGRLGANNIVRPSAYAVIGNEHGQIAIVHTPKGTFLPGGGTDEGESAETTVERESKEECGFTVRVGTWRAHAIEHVYSVVERAQFEKLSTFCDATVIAISHGTEPDHELAWVTVADAERLLSRESHVWAVRQWADRPSRD